MAPCSLPPFCAPCAPMGGGACQSMPSAHCVTLMKTWMGVYVQQLQYVAIAERSPRCCFGAMLCCCGLNNSCTFLRWEQTKASRYGPGLPHCCVAACGTVWRSGGKHVSKMLARNCLAAVARLFD